MKLYPPLIKPVRPYPPGEGPILMWMHPVLRIPVKIALWLIGATILLPLSYALMLVCLLSVIGGLKIIGL